MAAHKQNKSTNPLSIAKRLQDTVYQLSDTYKQEQNYIIDTRVCSVDEKPIKTGLQRHIARHNKTVLMQERI